MNAGNRHVNWLLAKTRMEKLKIHASETAWVGTDFDYVFANDTSIDDLYDQVKQLINPEQDHLDATESLLYEVPLHN
jgi:hypothetical protein